MNFYSDNGADEFVSQLLPAFGYAVDVGANDGVTRSNSKHFEDKGWIVLCIEPNPLLAHAGKNNRKLWRQIACGRVACLRDDFAVIGEYPYAALSGFHPQDGPDYSELTKAQSLLVKQETLSQVLEGSGFPRLDYLTIDVEGHELEVLAGLDWSVWHPLVVAVEGWTEQRNAEIDALLVKQGYCFRAAKQYDRIYVTR